MQQACAGEVPAFFNVHRIVSVATMESVGWVCCVGGGLAELSGSGGCADCGRLNSMRRAMPK